MAETLLLPMVRGVAGKAANALVQTVTRMCGVDDDRCKLERQLLAVQCKLADAEVKSETNPYVKRWMKDFRTVAYEADDVLDDFQYEALRREAKRHKVLSRLTSQVLFRLNMSRKLSNVLQKINKLVDEMNKFGLMENRAEAPQVLYQQTHAALEESAKIFGRGDDKEMVVKMLLDQQDQKNVHVLPIFGMGGLGKTTLAKMVYNDLRVQQHFQLNMWHCVSEIFEATAIVKSVIELATKERCNLKDNMELLRRRLQKVIGQKRYLIVLDDVRNEEERKWQDEVKPLLCSVGGPGSIIVVTCQSQQVASIMGTLEPYKLACLSEDDSWELFSRKAFSNGVEEQAELVTIGRRIVKKCRGLPLALKTMGGLMSSIQPVREWEVIEESKFGDNKIGDNVLENIFGRGDDKDMVVKLLLDQQDQKNVHVLPIFGMGGLGKTTLAKMAYNDPRVQQHFQLNMWHCVSENFEATAIVKSVIELATNERYNLPDTIELLRRRLQEVIGQKRYLLVLDDVWNEEERKWEELKPLLCSVGGPGSIIVVTCRSQQVASIMGTLGPHKLACLSEDASWELFSKIAFSNGVEEQAKLVTIGGRIVKKCGGLPLALKIMGGLMSSKQQVWEWEVIEESNLVDNARGKYEILPILKLSYQHLTSEMKQCFAFCAVFPKDYEMQKDILIQLWMANGFIQEDGTMDLAQKGEFIFNNLVWKSFLQDVKEKEFYPGGTTYESTVCKMSFLVHDLAEAVTDECATTEELIQQKASLKDARHTQIARHMSRSELEQISGLLKGTTSLCTLLVTEDMDVKELKLISLRALRCFSSSVTNSQVINAKHLRYLDLSGSDIVRLPDAISMLYHLQTLRLNGCWQLQRLPGSISAMRKLIHIYLLGCDALEQMPPNISLLSNLRTLTTFVVDTEAGRGIEELKDLQHLANRLELYNLRKVKSGQDANEANLHRKLNIRELFLCWGRRRTDMPEDEACGEKQMLECLAPHSKLEILEVHGYVGVEISGWMRNPWMLQCLRKLTISNCPRCKDLPIVWLSTSLEYLEAENMGSLTTLSKSIEVETEGYSSCVQFFPKLKKMVLGELPSLDRWTENSAGEPDSLVMFPVLKELSISSCPKLASVPGSPVLQNLIIRRCCSLPVSSLAHLTTLSELEYDGTGSVSASIPLRSWPSLVELKVSSETNMMMVLAEEQQSQSQRRPLKKLRKLSLEGLNCFVTPSSSFKSHLGLWGCFAFVEELVIHGCNELVRWPVEELQSLVRLRSLVFERCDSLQEIRKLPASLEQLKISCCIKLVALPSNLEDLAKLVIITCSGLKVLPDGILALERLEITDCPGIEEFPRVLLQRLPALEFLHIRECPELQRRCREGGVYFHLVSFISYKDIPEPVFNKKKILKRL